MIPGVIIEDANIYLDDRGYVQELSGQHDIKYAYLSVVNRDVVKGLHMHQKQTDNIVCIKGNIKLILVETHMVKHKRIGDVGTVMEPDYFEYEEEVEEIKEKIVLYIGEQNPKRVRIPVGIYHGWMPVGCAQAYIINTPDFKYDRDNPDEHRRDFDAFGVDWGVTNR